MTTSTSPDASTQRTSTVATDAGLSGPIVITPAVDPATDQIVDRVDCTDWPFVAKATSLFGLPLAAFITVDSVIGAVRGRRAAQGVRV